MSAGPWSNATNLRLNLQFTPIAGFERCNGRAVAEEAPAVIPGA